METSTFLGGKSLEILTGMEQATGTELGQLLSQFHADVSSTANCPEKLSLLVTSLQELNPYFQPNLQIKNGEAGVLYSVVAGVYAPLIHGFARSVVNNVQAGNIPSTIIAPPRDTIPLVHSLRLMSNSAAIPLTILTPPNNRNIAGISNSQKGGIAQEHPLFKQMLIQELTGNSHAGYTEIETGIYGTTSLKMARTLSELGLINGHKYVSMKLYGLGPNLSYVHAILSQGNCWVANTAETENLVDPCCVADNMLVLDSLEEIGMQNMYQSVENLIEEGGVIKPQIVAVDEQALTKSLAANQAIIDTAELYSRLATEQLLDLNFSLLSQVHKLMELAAVGIPVALCKPIPPMSGPYELFTQIQESGLFHYPNNLTF